MPAQIAELPLESALHPARDSKIDYSRTFTQSTMHISYISSMLVAALYLLESAQAKAVFAHYMVSSTQCCHCQFTHADDTPKVLPVTEAHAQQDIDNAISIG